MRDYIAIEARQQAQRRSLCWEPRQRCMTDGEVVGHVKEIMPNAFSVICKPIHTCHHPIIGVSSKGVTYRYTTGTTCHGAM